MAYKIIEVKNKVLQNGVHYLTSDYKTRNSSRPTHSGMDLIGKNMACDYIVAIDDGVVTSTNYDSSSGYYVKIKHANNYSSVYCHMKKGTFKVSNNEKVTKGQVLGYTGSTGNSTGAHLHFGVKNENNVVVDPLPYLNGTATFNNTSSNVDITQLAKDVINGKYGNGQERKDKLGSLYNEVQKKVNELLSGTKKVNSTTYIVKKGDNLTKIAKKHGTTWKKIYNDNKSIIGSNPNLIIAGQQLIINK